jgi:hypothetical protein
LHLREHVGFFTFFSRAFGFHTSFPQTAQATTRPAFSASVFSRPAVVGLHPTLQYRFLFACSLVLHWNGDPHFRHAFQKGYRLLALQCLGCGENLSSASFNNATMVSGDKLVRVIRPYSVGGIIVVIDEQLLHGHPFQTPTVNIITQCGTPVNGPMVRLPPPVNQDLRVLTQAPIKPKPLIPYLKPGIFDRNRQPVISATATKGDQVPARFQHPQDLTPHVDVVSDPGAVPSLAHEPQFIRGIGHAGMAGLAFHPRQHLKAIAVYQLCTHSSLLFALNAAAGTGSLNRGSSAARRNSRHAGLPTWILLPSLAHMVSQDLVSDMTSV